MVNMIYDVICCEYVRDVGLCGVVMGVGLNFDIIIF